MKIEKPIRLIVFGIILMIASPWLFCVLDANLTKFYAPAIYITSWIIFALGVAAIVFGVAEINKEQK